MIETARLLMRPWRDDDRDWAAAQAASPVAMEHLGGVQARVDSDERIDRMMRLQEERGHCFWVLERSADGRRIGMCGLKLFDAPDATLPGELEIGWRLDPDCWGQGYAREAARASLDHGFRVLAGPRVVALTTERNTRSWGLMERLGMTRRPDLDFDDPRYAPKDNPTIVYVIEAHQWRM